MILLDTNVLSELTKPTPSAQVVTWLAVNEPALAVPTIRLGLFGAFDDPDRPAADAIPAPAPGRRHRTAELAVAAVMRTPTRGRWNGTGSAKGSTPPCRPTTGGWPTCRA